MEHNLVLDSELTQENQKTNVELVSGSKFIILYVVTLGLYGLWWQYKTWRFFKEKDDLDIMPVARTIFSIFFLYGLFERIKVFAKSTGWSGTYHSGFIFFAHLATGFLGYLPEPFWLLSNIGVFFMIQPFYAFNAAIENSEEYTAAYKSGFNGPQTFLLVAGGLFWTLLLFGLFSKL